MPTLRVLSGPAAGESLGIEKEVVIGREDADLTITDPQISRRHTALRPVEDGVEIEDLGSLNGTFVNGEKLTAPMTLTSTGKIRIGDSELEVDVGPDGLTQMAASPAAEAPRGFVRRVDEEAPAAAAAAVAAPPADSGPAPARHRPLPPGAARPGTPPVPPIEGPPPRRRRRLPALLLGLLLVGGAIAAILYFTLSEDDTVTAQPLVASLRTADIVQGKKAITFAGVVNQTPGGVGTVIARVNLNADITAKDKVGKAVKVNNGSMVFRFDDGRIDATVTGTATRRADKTTDLVLTGKIIRGTREYEGAKGSFSLKSNQEVATVPTVGIGSFEGTIRY
jgi:hypothetical protein